MIRNNINKFVICLVAMLSSLTVLQAQEKTPFDYLDVFELQYVSDPQISPDGNRIVYVRNQFDIMTDRKYTNLWIINFDGSGHQALTSGKKAYFSPRWSPDGKRLAFVSTEEGSAQIFVRWMDSGQVASITNLSTGPGNISWSPDGKLIAFIMNVAASAPKIGNFPGAPKGAVWAPSAKVIDHLGFKSDGNFNLVEPGFNHLFVVSADGGAARQLTSGNFNHAGFSWTTNSKAIILSANREENAELNPLNSHLYSLNVSTGAMAKLTSGKGPHNSPVVSPDGNTIAFTGFDDQYLGYQLSRLYTLPIGGGNKVEINHGLDRDLENLNWAADGKSIFGQYDDQGSGKLVQVNLTGKVAPVALNIGGTAYGRPYSSGSYSIAASGKYAYTQTSTEVPAELAVGQFPAKIMPRMITQNNQNFLSGKKLGKVEELRYQSKADQVDVQGWIVYPPDFDASKKYPLILEIHGGPYAAYGPHFSPELQLMASKGYVVLYTNPRGSTSYGEKFAAYINNNYPSEDYVDLMTGIDKMIEKGFINEKELFITGGSGGGVLTAWSIGKTDRFAAAVVSKPVINWYSFSLTADGLAFFSKYWFNKKPWEDPKQYLDRSPISLVGNVKTPTLMVTGEQDFRTPMSETEQYYAALKLQGVPSAMVRIQEASHGITVKPSNMIRHVGYITGWFDQYREKK